MNKQNFLQTGGYPLETDTLDNMQTAYDLFNALGEIAGNFAIIKGCVVAGTTVGDGVVYINGEVFKFVGGNVQTSVRILQNVTTKPFENGDVNEVHYERYVTFASGVDSIPWANFTRLTSLIEMQKAMVPVGMISMWSGAIDEIPARWALCNGENGTPNLSGRFIVGYNPADADYNAIGNTGGEKEVTLTVNQMPSHNHGGTTSTNGAHTHSYDWENTLGVGSEGAENGESSFTTKTTSSAGNHNHTISSQGGGQAHENRPPYYTLAYIIYTGIL